MEQNKKVFISSSLRDLYEHRQAVIEVLEKSLGLYVIRNDGDIEASPSSPIGAMYRLIDECDIFIGIYARRYGFIAEGQRTSFIELEYEYAKRLGKPILCFLLERDYPWSAEMTDQDPYLLENFLTMVMKEHLVSFFTTPTDLAEKTYKAVEKVLAETGAEESPSSSTVQTIPEESEYPVAERKAVKRTPRRKVAPSPEQHPAQESLGFEESDRTPQANSDRPSGQDRLNYSKYAQAFARIILNPDTSTPLTIGIYGQWGQGKSFLMGKIKEEIKKEQIEKHNLRVRQSDQAFWGDIQLAGQYVTGRFSSNGKRLSWRELQEHIRQRRLEREVDSHIVEFNAWAYVGTENLWAGLVTRLYEEAEKYFGLQLVIARLWRVFRRSWWKSLSIFAFYALLGMAISLVIDSEKISESFGSLAVAVKTFGVSALGGAGIAGLPVLWNSLKGLMDNLFQTRSKSLQDQAARPDFKAQIGIMAEIKREISFIGSLLRKGKNGRLTRFILLIDDLDRCEFKKAVEVLQAIMLLLTDEDGAPFVIFLSLDARVLVRAIEATYGDVLVKAGINGYEYLDKIVQVPFVIPAASGDEIGQYVDSMLWSSEAEKDQISKRMAAISSADNPPAVGASNIAPKHEGDLQPSDGGPKVPSSAGSSPAQVQLERIPTMFTQSERKAIMQCADDLMENPRKIKRIINIYRFTRQLLPASQDREKAIRWVLLTEQWPFHVAWLLEQIENDTQTQKAELNNKTILDVYNLVRGNIYTPEMETLLGIDADPDLFDQFIKKPPVFTVQEIKNLLPLTINLNPAIRSEVSKQGIRLAGLQQTQIKKKLPAKKPAVLPQQATASVMETIPQAASPETQIPVQ